jgi:hypothetical protein
MTPWITNFLLLVISNYKSRVGARNARQCACPRITSVVCGYAHRIRAIRCLHSSKRAGSPRRVRCTCRLPTQMIGDDWVDVVWKMLHNACRGCPLWSDDVKHPVAVDEDPHGNWFVRLRRCFFSFLIVGVGACDAFRRRSRRFCLVRPRCRCCRCGTIGHRRWCGQRDAWLRGFVLTCFFRAGRTQLMNVVKRRWVCCAPTNYFFILRWNHRVASLDWRGRGYYPCSHIFSHLT